MSNQPRFSNVEARNTIDYMLRTTQQHHVQVSMMADTKANIIITVSSIVLTLAMGQLGGSMSTLHPIALATLLLFTLAALLLAVLAVLPKFRPLLKNGDEVLPSQFNLLFFGHFSQLSLDKYMSEMERLLLSDPKAYDAICKDLYELGCYLARHKYRYLRYAYLFFLAGFLVTFLLQVYFTLV